MIQTVEWAGEGVRLIDQTRLPGEETYITCRTSSEVARAIRDMVVRGAPAIGVTAAMGIALGLRDSPAVTFDELYRRFEAIASEMAATRPTAVNLFWAIERMRATLEGLRREPVASIKAQIAAVARQMHAEDVAACRAIGDYGAGFMPDDGGVLTHCNAGALATCGYGTALGVIRSAIAAGKQIHVYADETRPFLQGSRLTAWELKKDGIPVTVISDNMAGAMMRLGKVRAVVVGADRIAGNGDVANKIGTYSVAVLAREHGIPFYVAAPWSTIDLNMRDGEHIPIEHRAARELTHIGGKRIAPEGIDVENPAFDVTPNKYVSAIITERGVLRPPYDESLAAMAREASPLAVS